MNYIKILHTADVHLGAALGIGRPDRGMELVRTFGRIVELATREAVAVILIAGDLFEGAALPVALTAAIRDALAGFPGRVFISPGNHDYISLDSPYLMGQWPDNVTIFRGGCQRVDLVDFPVSVFGGGFEQTAQIGSLLPAAQELDPARINLGVFHGELIPSGQTSRYHGITLAQIGATGLDYLALGHIHQRTEPSRVGKTTFAYPGCPDGHGFDETGLKGIYLGEVGSGQARLEFVPVSSRRYEQLSLDISAAGGESRIRDRIRELLQEHFGGSWRDHFYRISLTGQLPPEQLPDWRYLEAALDEEIHSIRLIDQTVPQLDLDELGSRMTLQGIFVRRIREELATADPAQRERLEQALTFGSRAFAGKGPLYED